MDKLDFIGSMPLNLNRKSLGTIQHENYFIAEKTDGIRYLLYVVDWNATDYFDTSEPNGSEQHFKRIRNSEREPKPTAILLDRSKKMYYLHHTETIGSALGLGTVLDGEYVYNMSIQRQVFR
jgi:hypothetical protein